MTRRLTLLHVLWDDSSAADPEACQEAGVEWKAALRYLAEGDVHEVIVGAEVEVPEDAVVLVHPCGRVEIASEFVSYDVSTEVEGVPEEG